MRKSFKLDFNTLYNLYIVQNKKPFEIAEYFKTSVRMVMLNLSRYKIKKPVKLKDTITKEQYIAMCKEKYGDKYDYSKVILSKLTDKIIIICNICHTEFITRADSHLRGNRSSLCINCFKKYKSFLKLHSDNEIKLYFKEIHKNNLDFSKFKYKGYNIKGKVICNKCGNVFYSTPANLLCGSGCIKCSEKRNGLTKLTTEEFIEKAKNIHGNLYDYSLVKYINAYTKVILKCNRCGKIFEINPAAHLNGSGCLVCNRKQLTNYQTMTIEEFIKRAKEIHGDLYDYSYSVYPGSRHKKIKIFCKRCGKFFMQAVSSHLRGCGCKNCNKSKGENIIQLWLENNKIKYESQKCFKQCKNTRLLPFDFYLPDYNICIEFQGEQHYHPIKFFIKHRADSFKLRQQNDKIKRTYCEKEGIKLIEIKYNENIEERLETELFS